MSKVGIWLEPTYISSRESTVLNRYRKILELERCQRAVLYRSVPVFEAICVNRISEAIQGSLLRGLVLGVKTLTTFVSFHCASSLFVAFLLVLRAVSSRFSVVS